MEANGQLSAMVTFNVRNKLLLSIRQKARYATELLWIFGKGWRQNSKEIPEEINPNCAILVILLTWLLQINGRWRGENKTTTDFFHVFILTNDVCSWTYISNEGKGLVCIFNIWNIVESIEQGNSSIHITTDRLIRVHSKHKPNSQRSHMDIKRLCQLQQWPCFFLCWIGKDHLKTMQTYNSATPIYKEACGQN